MLIFMEHTPVLRVLRVHSSSDARGGYITADGAARPPLTMTLYAVPAERRLAVRQELVKVWLAEACSWVAASRGRGNAWSSSDHEWVLGLRGDDLVVIER